MYIGIPDQNQTICQVVGSEVHDELTFKHIRIRVLSSMRTDVNLDILFMQIIILMNNDNDLESLVSIHQSSYLFYIIYFCVYSIVRIKLKYIITDMNMKASLQE